MKHSFYPILFVLVFLLSLLMGCQLQANSKQTANLAASTVSLSSGSNSPAAATGTATLAATANQTSTSKLVIWLPPQFDPVSGSAVSSLIQDRLNTFQEKNPGITVEIRLKSMDGKGGLLDSLMSASEAAPDALPLLIALPYDEMQDAALHGLLVPLSDSFLEKVEDSWLPYTSQLSQVQNITYGFPFAADALVMVYHPGQVTFPPNTWQELTSQKKTVIFPAADPEATVVTAIYQTVGGNLSSAENGQVLDKNSLEKTLSIIDSGVQSGIFPVWITDEDSFEESWKSYKTQNSGYVFAWASQYLSDPIPGTTLSPIPAFNTQQVTRTDGWVWAIPAKNSLNQKTAILLTEYLSAPEFVDQFDQKAGYLPVYNSGMDLISDTNLKNTIVNLFSTAQIAPSESTINSIDPVLENMTVQMIKKELSYQNALDQTLKKINNNN